MRDATQLQRIPNGCADITSLDSNTPAATLIPVGTRVVEVFVQDVDFYLALSPVDEAASSDAQFIDLATDTATAATIALADSTTPTRLGLRVGDEVGPGGVYRRRHKYLLYRRVPGTGTGRLIINYYR